MNRDLIKATSSETRQSPKCPQQVIDISDKQTHWESHYIATFSGKKQGEELDAVSEDSVN